MSNPLFHAWHPAAAASDLQPIEAVRQVTALLEGVNSPSARHVARALRMYLDGRGDDITRNLGLKPRRAGRYEDPRVREKYDKRNGLISEFVGLQPGRTGKARAQAAAALLARRDAAGVVSDAAMDAVAERLLSEFQPGELPTSWEQFYRIAKAG